MHTIPSCFDHACLKEDCVGMLSKLLKTRCLGATYKCTVHQHYSTPRTQETEQKKSPPPRHKNVLPTKSCLKTSSTFKINVMFPLGLPIFYFVRYAYFEPNELTGVCTPWHYKSGKLFPPRYKPVSFYTIGMAYKCFFTQRSHHRKGRYGRFVRRAQPWFFWFGLIPRGSPTRWSNLQN